MTIPALNSHAQYTLAAAAMAEKVARALNRLGADRDLLDSADADTLLDLINDYFDDTQGIAPPFNQTSFNNTSQYHNNNKKTLIQAILYM